VEPLIQRISSLDERTPNGQYQLLVLSAIPGHEEASVYAQKGKDGAESLDGN
jgi:hypothetical protein